jgi:hypothetical protein
VSAGAGAPAPARRFRAVRRLLPLAILCTVATACGGSTQPHFTGIAYTKYVGGTSEVWLAAADGTGKRRLARGRGPQISPDGRWVAFEGSCDGSGACEDLFVVATSGGRPRLRARRTFATAWTADSRRRNRRQLSGPTPRRLLGSGITGLVPIAWRSGVVVAGLANEFGAPPYVVDPRRHTVRELGRYGYHAWPDGLSRDGRAVLVEAANVEVDRFQRVEVIPVRGGRAKVIARYAGEASWNL